LHPKRTDAGKVEPDEELNMPQQQQNDSMNWKRNFDISHALCVMHQRALVVPMRSRWGIYALGVPCALALVLMVLWATFSRDPYMWVWIGFWVICQLARRAESVRLHRRGERIHSQYDGYVAYASRWRVSESTAKLVIEPVVFGVFGLVLFDMYRENGLPVQGLPYFFLAGLFSLPFVETVKRSVWERRAQAMVDARVEQEALVKEVRDRWGDQ
jgi:hypothetical protein